MSNMTRRGFFGASLAVTAATLFGKDGAKGVAADEFTPPQIAFPQKKPLKTISDRPPLLESPRDIFTNAITPNDQFFVRWHICRISRRLLI